MLSWLGVAERDGARAAELGPVRVSVLPTGRPSSLAEPASVAPDGSVIVWSVPAFTIGAWLPGPPG